MRKASAILLDLVTVAEPILLAPRSRGQHHRAQYSALRAEIAAACDVADRRQFLEGAGTLLIACCWHVLFHAEKSAEADDMTRWQMAGLMFVPMAKLAAGEAVEYEKREGVAG